MNFHSLITMTVVAGGASTQQDTISKTADKVLDSARAAVVQLELQQIRTAFVTEMVMGNVHKVKRNYSQFIRESMTATNRDPSNDLWGNPYTMAEYKDRFELVSLGPDGIDETDDDLYVVVGKK